MEQPPRRGRRAGLVPGWQVWQDKAGLRGVTGFRGLGIAWVLFLCALGVAVRKIRGAAEVARKIFSGMTPVSKGSRGLKVTGGMEPLGAEGTHWPAVDRSLPEPFAALEIPTPFLPPSLGFRKDKTWSENIWTPESCLENLAAIAALHGGQATPHQEPGSA